MTVHVHDHVTRLRLKTLCSPTSSIYSLPFVYFHLIEAVNIVLPLFTSLFSSLRLSSLLFSSHFSFLQCSPFFVSTSYTFLQPCLILKNCKIKQFAILTQPHFLILFSMKNRRQNRKRNRASVRSFFQQPPYQFNWNFTAHWYSLAIFLRGRCRVAVAG